MTKHSWWAFVNTECPCGKPPSQHLSPTVKWVDAVGRFELDRPARCPVRQAGRWTYPRAPFTTRQHIELALWARSTGIRKHRGRTWRGWMRLPSQRKKRHLKLVA